MALPAKRPLPRALNVVVTDGSILVGSGLLTYGAWLIYDPAGFVVAGVLLLALGLRLARG